MAAQIRITTVGVPSEKDTGISRSVVTSADSEVGRDGSAFSTPVYKDKPLRVDAARPKGSSGAQDPRALDAPMQPNGGHVLGLRRPD